MLVPVVRHVRTDEDQVARLEEFDVIGHEARARTPFDQGELGRTVVVPVVALPGERHRLVRSLHDLDAGQAARPAQQPEGLTSTQPDVFPHGLHRPVIRPD